MVFCRCLLTSVIRLRSKYSIVSKSRGSLEDRMFASDFLSLCGTGFLAVFLLLIILALLMRTLTFLFPEKEVGDVDAAMVASIVASVTAVHPGTRITKIEKLR